MTTELTTFTFAPANANVRVVTIDGKPWFVAADVCAMLGYNKVNNALHLLDADEHKAHKLSQTTGRPNSIISEPGLYKLIQSSRRPEAREFDRWVRHDVLPAIRKDGMYVMGEEKVATGRGPPSIELNVAWGQGTGTTIDREPRVLDTDLAVALGYAVPRQIRRLIMSHDRALTALGVLRTATVRSGPNTTVVYYLNKAQAIFLTTQSGTATAIDITVEVIRKFDAYEKGLVTAAPAMPAIPTTFAEALRLAAEEVERRVSITRISLSKRLHRPNTHSRQVAR